MNRVIKRDDLDAIYVIGPGHGGPAIVANAYLEGTYSEVYPSITPRRGRACGRLFRQFSFPGGIPSHVAPETPGSIHEGGELGYALSHAYGAAFDNPDLARVRASSATARPRPGPLATSWHSNKFLNPVTDGAVLPILHLNGYKIANPTVLARIPREELDGADGGLRPHAVLRRGRRSRPTSTSSSPRPSTRSLDEIREIQRRGPRGRRHRAAALADDRPPDAEGLDRARRRSTASRSRATGAATRCRWARSATNADEPRDPRGAGCGRYRPEELFDDDGTLLPELAALAARRAPRRMSANPVANGGELLRDLAAARLPRLRRRRPDARRDDRRGDARPRDVRSAT